MAEPLRTAIVLPRGETFSPEAAGAIAMVARRFALAVPGSVVLGQGGSNRFPGIPFIEARGAWAVIRALATLRPQVIDVHQRPRLALALSYLFPQARVQLFLHNDPLTMRGLKSAAARALALKRMHRVVCVSAHLRDRYATGLRQAPEFLHNPLTLAELPPPCPKEKLILFVGRVVETKAPDVFIAACKAALPQLPGWSARMIGGDRFGPDSPETCFVAAMRAAAAVAGVEFRGVRSHQEVLETMARAAIVVVPSRWAEPFGLTALEALASGAALISTGQGGLCEVSGEAALYVPPDDPVALTNAILHLARDDAARTALGEAGRARASGFDTPLLAARLQALRGEAGSLNPVSK
jgi:glycosyltransferase involved in cell wall biosynthesis